jgi:hypothetical protein
MNFIWISLIFFITFINSANVHDSIIDPSGDASISAGTIIESIFYMAIGLVFVFLGKRLTKITLFLVSFGLCTYISFMISSLITMNSNVTNGQQLGIIIGSVIVGLLGGLVSWRFYKVGVFNMGYMAGYHLTGVVLCGLANLDKSWIVFGVMIACGIVVGAINLIFLDTILIVSSAFVGGQVFMEGIDVIVKKGYLQIATGWSRSGHEGMTPVLWGMLFSSIAITMIGVLFQHKVFRKKQIYTKVEGTE